MTRESETARQRWLGIEGGGTRTIALMADGTGKVVQRLEAGPANLKLLTDAQLTRHFRSLATRLPGPDGLAIGLAGAWGESDCKRIRSTAAKVWPGTPCYATSDLEVALVAATDQPGKPIPKVLIVSGTGSGCYAKTAAGEEFKIGAWGHVLGDRGSGFEIGLHALRAVVAHFDRQRTWPKLGQRILRSLELNEPNELIAWAQSASKTEIAGLAVEVFALGPTDKLAHNLVRETATRLAEEAVVCANRLARPGRPIRFVLAGSLLIKQAAFAKLVTQRIRQLWPGAKVTPLVQESVWGAVELARTANIRMAPSKAMGELIRSAGALPRSRRMSPTERRNPRSMNLDKLPVKDAVALMLSEDAKIPRALAGERNRIAQVVNAIFRSFRQGGRLFYVGAGTSGRLGVLDASECPPTFRTSPEQVQAIIAGGQSALWKSIEGAEDDEQAAVRSIALRGVARRDTVIGIAASGTTPFVWGALGEAKRRRATTVLICFNPYLEIPPKLKPTIVIAPDVGPEILTGSTRLKAGTATKLLLNIFTTLAMVRMGKVVSNLMVDLLPANVKLRDRAARIVCDLTGVDMKTATVALERNKWLIKKASAALKRRPAPRVSGTALASTSR